MQAMNAWLGRLRRAADPRLAWRRWRRDEAGAALVQFVVVLPVFVLVVVGLWAIFQVYSAHQTLCEAVWGAARYLQVEGPMFDPIAQPYPLYWEQEALEIINTELKSNAAINIAPVAIDNVDIWPEAPRRRPEDTTVVNATTVEDAWFFLKASTTITNTLALFVPGTGPGGALNLTCIGTAFYEDAPLGPTDPQEGVACPDVPRGEWCTRVPPGRPTPEPTECNAGDPYCGCPVCRPR